MHITKIDNPNTKAEGLCDGLPYTTDCRVTGAW